MPVARTRLRVTGTVQGVGFRPFVYRHAVALGLDGYVLNDSDGVLIVVQGEAARIDELARLLVERPPPLARVAGVSRASVVPEGGADGFRIVESEHGGAPAVPVSIDSATCDDCLGEVFDPADRRFRYPFTNCTNCGPRYTIVLGVPYDRPMTTMAGFAMCPRCQAEYDDPADRRFHAQPNACPDCGPQLAWHTAGGVAATRDAALHGAVATLRGGGIVAMKGIGGYHLAVDATDWAAVAELRRRKARDDKPFAVMVPDVETAALLCHLDQVAVEALASPRRPIVLAERRPGGEIAPGVAPGLPELGLMLPYTPLHHLVLADVGVPLVMTSGNSSDEPIAHLDDDARTRLMPMADGVLSHDRAIHIRCDDSVVRASRSGLTILRRSRGFAPEPLPLPFTAHRPVLAVGAEMKSTIAVADHEWVVPSHHIGDLEHLATYTSFLQAVDHLRGLYGVVPEVVAHDLHPEYLSSKYAQQLELQAVAVQHHHAHVAACMVEHGRTDRVLGVAFDGLGFGSDGTWWGGELLAADLVGAERLGHLLAVPMTGGVQAIREPWRMAAVWAEAAGERDGAARLLDVEPGRLSAVLSIARSDMTTSTTSMGRLFDAVAALLGCRQRVSYEAQAAIELEAMARTVARSAAPRFEGMVVQRLEGDQRVLDPLPLVARLVADRLAGVDPRLLAAGFHEAIGRAAADAAASCAGAAGLDTVVLTGGVFQNCRLQEVVAAELRAIGLTVLCHATTPPNDGGISIGQAAIAAFAAPEVLLGASRRP